MAVEAAIDTTYAACLAPGERPCGGTRSVGEGSLSGAVCDCVFLELVRWNAINDMQSGVHGDSDL